MMPGLIGCYKKLFITGTDTSVGKTYFACRLVRHLSEKGKSVGVMKPIETGIQSLDQSDGYRLKMAALSNLPIEMISPYRFKTPAAPRVAALRENRRINIQKVLKCYHDLTLAHDWVIVEGAGGLMVPILRQFDMSHLIQALHLPLILVAPQKLGTINQTLLSIYLAKSRGLNILAVVLNQVEEKDQSGLQKNERMIKENCDIPVLTFQHSKPDDSRNPFWKQFLG